MGVCSRVQRCLSVSLSVPLPVSVSVFVSVPLPLPVSVSVSVSVSVFVSVSTCSQGHFEFEDQAALVLTYLRHDAPKQLLKQFSQRDIRQFMRHLLVALQQVLYGSYKSIHECMCV